MASYQDIDSRLRSVEDKLEFVMKAFTVTKREESRIMPGEFLTQTKDLLSIYREAVAAGARLLSVDEYNSEVEKGIEQAENGTL